MSVSGELYTCHFVSRQRFADTLKKELDILIPEDASVWEENRAQLKGALGLSPSVQLSGLECVRLQSHGAAVCRGSSNSGYSCVSGLCELLRIFR